MIFESLNCLAIELNLFLKNSFNVQDDKVVVSAIVNQDGSVAVKDENNILITLVNARQNTQLRNSLAPTRAAAPPLNLELSVLFSSYFSSYSDSLKFLSYIILFFEAKMLFDKANTPQLPTTVDKLVVARENVDIEQQKNIWLTLGVKYMPSALYLVRILGSASLEQQFDHNDES